MVQFECPRVRNPLGSSTFGEFLFLNAPELRVCFEKRELELESVNHFPPTEVSVSDEMRRQRISRVMSLPLIADGVLLVSKSSKLFCHNDRRVVPKNRRRNGRNAFCAAELESVQRERKIKLGPGRVNLADMRHLKGNLFIFIF